MQKVGIYRCKICDHPFEDATDVFTKDFDGLGNIHKVYHICNPGEKKEIHGLGEFKGYYIKLSTKKS